MIEHYLEAVRRALSGVVELLTQLALPLAIGLGLLLVAAIVTLILQRDNDWRPELPWRRQMAVACGYGVVGLFLVVAWAALRTTRPLAQQDIRWRESAEATANPVPDAPPVSQYGPAVAALNERTYTRTLTLPPDFLSRIGAEGVGVLAPYLTDPSAQNVIRLRDTFRRSGRDVVFTRQATLLNEEPIPFANSQIHVKFQRLGGRAYEVEFEGHYAFQNAGEKPNTIHFLFTLPEAGAIRDLSVTVGGQAVTEPAGTEPGGAEPDDSATARSHPGDSDTYEWRSEMKPGERREAVVRYRVIGARTWRYDLGSQRRRVQQFRLEADPGGLVGFLRGSLQPTSDAGGTLRWEMADVVTAQQIALAFPPDTLGKQLYLQALSALPASLMLCLIGVLAIGLWFLEIPSPARLLGGLILFAFGLGASTVLAIYLGPVVGVILGPLLGAGLAALVLGRHSLLALLPSALVP
ncbi:MAG: hypothetical protein M3347_01105, partial [Armatimonadota bacterium]|nr:hypothetical protein [Armatimonadota bacterium]